MHRFYLLPVLCMMIYAGAAAQRKAFQKPIKGTTVLRLNPAGLFDMQDFNLTPGIEYIFSDRWSAAADIGWIFYSKYFIKATQGSGFIIRPSIRRYTGKSGRLYTEAVIHYKKASYTVHDWLGRNTVNGVPAYEEKTRFRYRKEVAGAHVNVGLLIPIFGNKRYWIECFAGLGLRYKKVKLLEDERSFYDDTESMGSGLGEDIDINKPTQWVPAFPGGIKLVYRL